MGILQRTEAVQILMIEPPLGNMAATTEPESRHCNRPLHKEIGRRVIFKKENSP